MRGYVYKLCIKDASIDDCYVGSTTNIYVRKNKHKYNTNDENNINHYNLTVYKKIRETGGFVNWDMHILEIIEYEDKRDLHKKEREWVEKLKPSLNSCVPYRQKGEWYNENRDEILMKKIEYWNKHDGFKEQRKIKKSCPHCEVKVQSSNLARHIKSKHKSA